MDKHFSLRISVLAAFSLGTACAAEPAPEPRFVEQPPAPEARKADPPPALLLAPVSATQLAFEFAPARDARQTSDKLLDALARAGFRFASPDQSEVDARFDVRIAADEATSRPKVSLLLVQGDAVIEWATAVLESDGEEDALAVSLVARMCGSARVDAFARTTIEDKQRSAARSRTMPRFAAEPATVHETPDPGLGEVALRRCRNARQIAACEPVLAYLRDHPNGSRAAQAEAAYRLAAARLERASPSPGEPGAEP